MADTRARVALNGKTVNLAQLSAELGGVGLAASETEVVAAEGVSLTKAQLTAAVAAHNADADYGMKPEQKRMRELGNKPTFTPAERDEALRLLLKRTAP